MDIENRALPSGITLEQEGRGGSLFVEESESESDSSNKGIDGGRDRDIITIF
jgi:hypothetical protein